MKTIWSAILLALGVIVFVAALSMFAVDQWNMALVQRFGEVTRTIREPGLYFKLPFIDVVTEIDKRERIWNSDDKVVQVADKKQYVVDMVTVLQVTDPEKFRQTVSADIERARKNIEARLDSALRQTYGKRTFDAALSKDRVVMMREIRDQVYPEAQKLGIDIVDVRIRQTDLMKEVLDSTYERMRSERFAEAQDLRSRGEAEQLNIQAQADRKKIEKVSDANRQSNIIRGAGDAESNRILAEVTTKDPEFYKFFRSMQAYQRALKGDNTNFVLAPDSEFFRYFGTTNGVQTPPKPAQQASPQPTTP